jgi:hypothetical protein
MTNQNNPKVNPREGIIFVLILAVISIIAYSFIDLINIQIFKHQKLFYCPGDIYFDSWNSIGKKYFLGANSPLECMAIINLFRHPASYFYFLLCVPIGFIFAHIDRNEK